MEQGITKEGRSFSRILIALLLGAAIAAALFYLRDLKPSALEARLESLGSWAPLVFVTAYALATVLFLPGSVFALAGGALFGPVLGTVYNLGAATVGATVAFLVARHLASEWVEKKSGRKLKQLMDGVEDEGWRFVAFVRLVPLFPFNLLNYALGLTRIKSLPYVLATAICMVPGAIAYTYLGYAGREAVAGSGDAIQKGLLALGLLAAVVFLPRLVKRLRKPRIIGVSDLHHRIDSGDRVLVLDVRDAKDFNGEHGHVLEAVNIPLSDLPNNLDGLKKYREWPLAVMCFTDNKSKAAVKILKNMGFVEAFLVEGGMKEWNRLGLPAEQENGVKS